MDLKARSNLMKVDRGNLKMQSIGKRDLLLFSFLGFRFFWNSTGGKTMPLLSNNPWWLATLIAIPYMLASLVHVHNFGGVKYFIRAENEVVGTALLKVNQDALSLRSLTVSPTKRKRGIGFFVLVQTEKFAKQMKLAWLEVEGLKGNVSALRLYRRFGFKIYGEGRLTFVLRKRV
jgi:ribosomal protein S18 acetylase RimI-like enzyme